MKQPIRIFSIGLFTATFILFTLYLFLEEDENKNNVDYSIEELSEIVEEKGYRVITEEDYITLSLLNDPEQAEEATTNSEEDHENEDDQQTSEDEEKTVSYQLEVTEGMLPGDVSELLEDNDIINNASELNDYLEDHGISTRIQLGSFELNNEMSISEIATVLTD